MCRRLPVAIIEAQSGRDAVYRRRVSEWLLRIVDCGEKRDCLTGQELLREKKRVL
ncbi:hypothetical protein J6590_061167 [Homalodisca vitripennis]|nr:hypothetical protein J6590_061167 [Homalodisca vitripennis]